MSYLCRVVAEYDPNEAERVARRVNHPDRQATSLAQIARASATSDPVRTLRLAAEVHDRAKLIADPARLSSALATAAPAVAAAGDHDRALTLSYAIRDPDWRTTALADVAEAIASSDPDRALRLTHTIDHPPKRAQALTTIALMTARHGDLERAEEIISGIGDPDLLATALSRLAEVAGPDLAARLIGEAFAIGPWWVPLPLVARLRPELVAPLADEVLATMSPAGREPAAT
jgi:hypothetical protein